jgi:predicted NACHT family NTPase
MNRVRGLKASFAGLKAARKAFERRGRTQDYLAGAIGCTRQTVSRFFSGDHLIEQRIFEALCQELGLDWAEIAEWPEGSMPVAASLNLDALVQSVRQQVQSSLLERCGTMRVLDMEQPIELNAVYTRVNFLKRIPRYQYRKIEDLKKNFDGFRLGKTTVERAPGLEIVLKHHKVMILGEPGAGKTTFLKLLTLRCLAGELWGDRVPFFVTLKEFAETEDRPGLLDFLAGQLAACGVPDAAQGVTELLIAGRAMILLDSLDEVQQQDRDRILRTIASVTRQFRNNQFVITCRIAANEYLFEDFTEVEIADFEHQQIAEFAYKWFQGTSPAKARDFMPALEKNQRLFELATNPLLLTLLCLVFDDYYEFPANRADLYARGVAILLSKWDAQRNINRDEIYKYLSLRRKEGLLSYVAYQTFKQGHYFFKKGILGKYIQDYICSILPANSDAEASLVNSEGVIQAIEAHHGLLVERAPEIYSFSHLTFHEYFTARYLLDNLDDLVKHITDDRWQEVFRITTEMLPNADDLLLLMKQTIDGILADDQELQQLLFRIEQAASSATDQLTAVRAYYLARYLAISDTFELSLVLDPTIMAGVTNLTHDFDETIQHLNDQQQNLLHMYYDANKLLTDCLNSDCYVREGVREAIESQLLLPQSSLKERVND